MARRTRNRFFRKAPPVQHPDAPLYLNDHRRPLSRREFIAQGFMTGAASVSGLSLFSLFANPRQASAALSLDLEALKQTPCNIKSVGAGKIPFICFDLAGGANFAGSNVLVGGPGGQLDFLTTAGYSKLGLPGDMIPPLVNPDTLGNDFVDTRLGLAFHSDSALLRGILERINEPATAPNINGCVIPARSDNDTGNNPHNPLYGIHRAGADGELLTLIGSVSSTSGGNSMAPADLINEAVRPTKIDRPSDVTGLVDTGKLIGLLNQDDAVAVMESMARISNLKLNQVSTLLANDSALKEQMYCNYIKSADLADRYGQPSALNPVADARIVGGSVDGNAFTPIFTEQEINASLRDPSFDREFAKTASVMKLVVNGYAGAGCITMGGFDYHTGNRSAGELRDLRAGRCIGACLEYAARLNTPLMIYVYSDGSVASNGMVDDSENGRGKGVWTGDNSSTACAFFLVYNPNGRPALLGGTPEQQARHQQLGYMRPDASVETSATPAANNVNLLVETVLLNYMALHGESGQFATLFPNHGLGNSTSMDALTAFAPIV